MDLASVPEIGRTFARKLQDAGVENVEAFVVTEDLAALAARSGVDEERLASFRDAARERVEQVLAEAGIHGPEALAAADHVALSERTGLSVDYIARYRAAAQHAVDGPEAKVVLVEGAPVARVHLSGATHHAVPLVTAGAADDEDAVLARAGGDAVVLRPQAEAASVLIAGVTHRALPLFKERRKEAGEMEEVRVRIVEIREVPAEEPKKKGGLGKLFGRKT